MTDPEPVYLTADALALLVPGERIVVGIHAAIVISEPGQDNHPVARMSDDGRCWAVAQLGDPIFRDRRVAERRRT